MILKRKHDVNDCIEELGTMHRPDRISIAELNQHLICVLCKGYFVDATTIIECLHSFCRSCIVQYLGKNKYCPVCDVEVHKTRPLLNIRPDKTLQAVVYKLVPGLFQKEAQKRNEFYTEHPDAKPSELEQNEEATYQYLLTPQETICVSLVYHDSKNTPRYLRCPAAVSIAHLQKLIRAKYDLTDQHRVDVLYNQDSLLAELTLIDIACIYLWKKKGPMELTYRIYEHTAKRRKLDESDNGDKAEQAVMNNNDWKEVQLQISENGEMSITGIQDSIEDIMSEQGIVETNTSTPKSKSAKKSLKKEMPGLKVIEKGKSKTPEVKKKTNVAKEAITHPKKENKIPEKEELEITIVPQNAKKKPNQPINNGVVTNVKKTSKNLTKEVSIVIDTEVEPKIKVDDNVIVIDDQPQCDKPESLTEKISQKTLTKLSSELTIEPIMNKKPPAKTSQTNQNKTDMKNVNNEVTVTRITDEKPNNTHKSTVKDGKHKVPGANSFDSDQPPVKRCKPTILNHSLNMKNYITGKEDFTVEPKSIVLTKPPKAVTQNTLEEQKWAEKYKYKQPKAQYYPPVLNVPKVQPGPSNQRYNVDNMIRNVATMQQNLVQNQPVVQPNPVQQQQQQQPPPNQPKPKNSIPLGYTLRNPPKSWNPQISRENLIKQPTAVPKYTDAKNIRPAKFFKMRNNMPRYLGNPASGVKPMYQVHVSPEKDKNQTGAAQKEKTEIKKHSIVKIDPKTLKPISERAPETSNLSNQSDLKINTSSVSIFNPLKLQSSPKNDRKSPKSPHSPKNKSGSPPAKREKLNLNFTPSNPFIPNLGSPNLNPNHFMYPTPGFPTYDPRVMAAYHSFLYGQRLPFPAPLPNMPLDALSQRKGMEVIPVVNNKLMSLPQSPVPKAASSTQNSNKQVTMTAKAKGGGNLVLPTAPSQQLQLKATTTPIMRKQKEPKPEKSLLNTVEKLSQNRAKENKKLQLTVEESAKTEVTIKGIVLKAKDEETNQKPVIADDKVAEVKENATIEESPSCLEKESADATNKPEESKKRSNDNNKIDGSLDVKDTVSNAATIDAPISTSDNTNVKTTSDKSNVSTSDETKDNVCEQTIDKVSDKEDVQNGDNTNIKNSNNTNDDLNVNNRDNVNSDKINVNNDSVCAIVGSDIAKVNIDNDNVNITCSVNVNNSDNSNHNEESANIDTSDNVNFNNNDSININSYNVDNKSDSVNVINNDDVNVNSGDAKVDNSDNVNVSGGNINVKGDNVNVANSDHVNVNKSDNAIDENNDTVNVKNTENVNVKKTDNVNVKNGDNVNVKSTDNVNGNNSDNLADKLVSEQSNITGEMANVNSSEAPKNDSSAEVAKDTSDISLDSKTTSECVIEDKSVLEAPLDAPKTSEGEVVTETDPIKEKCKEETAEDSGVDAQK